MKENVITAKYRKNKNSEWINFSDAGVELPSEIRNQIKKLPKDEYIQDEKETLKTLVN